MHTKYTRLSIKDCMFTGPVLEYRLYLTRVRGAGVYFTFSASVDQKVYPNWWNRMWQWFLLGWTWEKL